MVTEVRKATAGWKHDAVSIGYPGPVVHGRLVSEPHNLGRGWVGDLQAKMLVQGDYQLQGVDRIEAQAARAKEELVIGDLRGTHLQHQVLDH